MFRILYFALAVAALSLAANAAPASAAQKFGPVTVTACKAVMVAGNPQPGMVRIQYFNNSHSTVLTKVTFRVLFHGTWSVVSDNGNFEPQAHINHIFDTRTGTTFDGTNPTQCVVTSAVLANGHTLTL